jgi:hypothetical protein
MLRAKFSATFVGASCDDRLKGGDFVASRLAQEGLRQESLRQVRREGELAKHYGVVERICFLLCLRQLTCCKAAFLREPTCRRPSLPHTLRAVAFPQALHGLDQISIRVYG